jgi:hypothetical protein
VAVALLEDVQQVVGQPRRPTAGAGPLGNGGLHEPAAAAALGGVATVGRAGQAAGEHQRLSSCDPVAGQGGPAGVGV